MVAGPLLPAEINESVEPILNLINGNSYLLLKLCCMKILLSPFLHLEFWLTRIGTEIGKKKQKICKGKYYNKMMI